jgi:DnaJ-class molecular chaperone
MPPDIKPIKCPTCNGSGKVMDYDLGFPQHCETCQGKGEIPAGSDTSSNLTLF